MSPSFATFLIASLVLAITPGPGVIYLLTRTLNEGRGAGLASVIGVALGNLGNAAIASLGLAVVVAVSSLAFAVVKFAGAAYLIYLGLLAFRSKPETQVDAGRTVPVRRARIFREGFFVALLNPKTALFFAALLPQFIQSGAASFGQTFTLGCVFVGIAMCTDTAYVFAATALASTIRHRSAWQLARRRVSAAILIGLGIYAALASPRAVK